MCGHGGCNCGNRCGCGRYGHRHGGCCCHHDEASACGGECACEQEAGGCQCRGGEPPSCGCGQGGHDEHHGHHEHRGHHAEHAPCLDRRFVSRAERISELEAYLSELRAEAEAGETYLKDIQAEAKGVEERIEALKAA